MRLKITKRLAGSIDGLHLDRFRKGEVYEVGTSLGNYLLAVRAAEQVHGSGPVRAMPIGDDDLLTELRRRLSEAGAATASAADPKPPDKRRE